MSYLNEIRPVLFLFCMMETLASIVLMRFELTGFYVVYKNPKPLVQEWMYFFYLVASYIFTVQNLFSGVSLCTSNELSIPYEVLRPLISCVLHLICSVLALFNAESDFMNASKKSDDRPLSKKPSHPYFNFNHLRFQGIASMVLSMIHMVHFLVALFVLLYEQVTDEQWSALGDWLNNFQWFRNFTSLEAEGNGVP